MLEKIEGIVVSETSYGESSKIINILTLDYGIVGIMAKGAKKVKSEFRTLTSKLTYAYFHVYYKKDKLSLNDDLNLNLFLYDIAILTISCV